MAEDLTNLTFLLEAYSKPGKVSKDPHEPLHLSDLSKGVSVLYNLVVILIGSVGNIGVLYCSLKHGEFTLNFL